MKLISLQTAQRELEALKKTLNVPDSIQKLDHKLDQIENEIWSMESELDDLRAERRKLEDRRDYLKDQNIKTKLSEEQRKEIEAQITELSQYMQVILHPAQTRITTFMEELEDK